MTNDAANKRMRLPTMPGGQEHFSKAREEDVESTRRAIAAAIIELQPVQGAAGYPSVDRLRAISGNGFGRSTAYRVIKQVHAAQEAWRERERKAGREIPAKLQARGTSNISLVDSMPQTARAKTEALVRATQDKLTRALQAVAEERAGAIKAREKAADLQRINDRLFLGIYDKVWADIEKSVHATLRPQRTP